MRRFLAICAFLLLPSIVEAAVSPEQRSKEDAIRELLSMTGASKLGIQMMQQMIPPLKQALPDLPESFWAEFMKEVKPGELVDLVVPIYARYFTQDELEELIRFNKTPLGQKLIATMPQISRESMEVGQEWGRRVAAKVIEKRKRRAD